MKLHPLAAAVVLALSALTLDAAAFELRRPYIVQLTDKPIASYTGEVSGYAATQPAPGQRLDLGSTEVQLYGDYLNQKKAAVTSAIAGAPITYNYNVVMNGFAAMLTDAEVRALKARGDVASITEDEPRHTVTSYTPAFLGLDKPNGLWSKLGGKTGAGENIIIGIVDSGVWPENPAFADRVDNNGKPTFDNGGTLVYSGAPAGWNGSCQSGEGFGAAHCNNKLIGAQFFDATYLSVGKETHWSEFRSPRDSLSGPQSHGGHGTHTATTAGGNAGVAVTVGGTALGEAAGMAPRARIAAYKVCWTYVDPSNPDGTGSRNSCYTGDSVAAIEKAIVDGVHVLNFSISGGASPSDPVEQAFLHAANAGVFVAASAGNAGPSNAVAHVSPWITTVAASTHDRFHRATVTLGNGASYTGASLNDQAINGQPMIRSTDAGLANADPTMVRLCYAAADNAGQPVLDPAKISGKMVVCDRGTTPRVNKSLAVQQAGGTAMVMVDNGAGLVGEKHAVPTIHVTAADGAAIKAYAATANSSAGISVFNITNGGTPSPTIADFSSRGPNMFDANLMKPDLTAPGVDILAGVTPVLSATQRADIVNGTFTPPAAWDFYQGTSMSSPHVAGLAALLKHLHPTWTPAMIKSALMTTAMATLPDAQTGDLRGPLPWGQGSGHVNPNGASDPGLVFAAVSTDYKKYMCSIGMAAECALGAIQTYNLNMPSISIGNVLGAVNVTRSVTNVGAAPAVYNATINVPGYTASVNPASLSLAAGETKSFTVTLTRNDAAVNTWYYGDLKWSDGSRMVRIPVTARSGKPITAPGLVKSDRTSASRILTVNTGFSGKMSGATGGMKEVAKAAHTVVQSVSGTVDTLAQIKAACNSGAQGTKLVPFSFAANTVAASFETFNRETSSQTSADDIDLALLNGAGNIVATALHAGSNESILLASPPAGSYKLCLINYAAANNSATTFNLHSAVVNTSDVGGNFKAMMPSVVYPGGTASVGTSWSGLAAGKRFLGGLRLLDASGVVGATTLFQVETNNPVPLAEPMARPAKGNPAI
jgi:hypothetical protein